MPSIFYLFGKQAALASLQPGTSEGVAGQGAVDFNQHRVDRTHRQDDAVHRAFDVNANQVDQSPDVSSDIGEPGVVSHRHKVAASGGAAVSSSSVVMPGTTTPSGATKMPGIKGGVDPRTDKPQGQNLQHGVQTVAYGADMGDSYTSFARRLQGSPV